MTHPFAALLLLASISCTPQPFDAPFGTSNLQLKLVRREREPKSGRERLEPERREMLRRDVDAHPADRGRRFQLVSALMQAGLHKEALREARRWRAKDAYNLIVVRLIGDIEAELGDLEAARRAYSAVVELLPDDPEPQRALAMVMRQAGDLRGAHERLQAAARLRPDDRRIGFELADTAHRLGDSASAVAGFRAVVADSNAAPDIVLPARQRLAQIYAAQAREALRRSDRRSAARLHRAIAALKLEGGAINDIKVYLSWDSDRTDIDLWVTSPEGERISYANKTGRHGEALFYDVTSGYGPETFLVRRAQPGTYHIQVNYFHNSRETQSEARGEVTVILGEGTAREERHILPYRLFQHGQVVSVADIEVR